MIFKNDKPEIQVPNSDLTSIVLAKVDELGDKAALIDGPTRRTLTYTQLRTQIHHLAAGLDQRGFKKVMFALSSARIFQNTQQYFLESLQLVE